MTNPHLDSLVVKQFRAFRNMEIARLGHVNLITGKNAVGKTALLEALRLYADSGSNRTLRQLLDERGELFRVYNQSESSSEAVAETTFYETVQSLFWRGADYRTATSAIEVGPLQPAKTMLTITPVSLVEEISEDRIRRYRPLNQQALFEDTQRNGISQTFVEQVPGLIIQSGTANALILPLSRLVARGKSVELRSGESRFRQYFVPAYGLQFPELAPLWEAITLTDREDIVKDALTSVYQERIEGINIVGALPSLPYRTNGTVLVRTKSMSQPWPLRSLGDGMMRAFGLALALVNARDGLLLVDEIDSGLHYSVQYQLWKLIFHVAQRLNVQVFATTHNWDTVATFQQAAAEQTDLEGMLIRLQRYDDDIVPTLFDERCLAIATRDQIEVR